MCVRVCVFGGQFRQERVRHVGMENTGSPVVMHHQHEGIKKERRHSEVTRFPDKMPPKECHCLSLPLLLVIAVIGIFAVLIIITHLRARFRKRKLHCGRLFRRTVSYNMRSQRSQDSQQNPVYGQPTTSGVTPEPESVSGCEIYEGQDDILTYEQKKRLGLCNVHKSTQTISHVQIETNIYDNFPHPQTMDANRRCPRRSTNMTCRKSGLGDYDYPLMHHDVSRGKTKECNPSDIYAWAVGGNRSSRKSHPSKRREIPPPCGHHSTTCTSTDVTDQAGYVNPNGGNACPTVEAVISDVSSDDTESSDNEEEDSHKIFIDQRLLEYVNTLKRNHNMYIEKYKTVKRPHHKRCTKTVSLMNPPAGVRRRANTGVLKLLERRTKVRQTFSIPVSIEPVSMRPRRPPPPCPTEVDYLKLL